MQKTTSLNQSLQSSYYSNSCLSRSNFSSCDQLISTTNSRKEFLPPDREFRTKGKLSSMESGPQRFPIIYYQNRCNYRRLVNFILLLSLLRIEESISIPLPLEEILVPRRCNRGEVTSFAPSNAVPARVACLARIIHPSNPIGTYRWVGNTHVSWPGRRGKHGACRHLVEG